MASTALASRLTEAHRLAQARLGAQAAQQLLAAWQLLDPAELDATLDRWLRVVVPLVNAQRVTSARLSANYLSTFRALELGSSSYVPFLVEKIAPEAVVTSMTVTGPVAIRAALGRGIPFPTAVDRAAAGMAAAGMRHVLGGGRDTISTSIEADRKALGYARVTSGKTCAFCAMLASRGPVYKSQASAERAKDGGKYHDSCNCTTEPVYREGAPWPAGAQRYHDLWQEVASGSDDPINTFRRALATT